MTHPVSLWDRVQETEGHALVGFQDGGHMTEPLENGAIKIIEIMGVSTSSYEDALERAVAKAAESINGIISLEVTGQSATVRDGRIARYEISARLSFIVR